MDLINYLGEKKLNELIIPVGTSVDIKAGGHLTRGLGFLGQRHRISEKQALKLSNTSIGTLYGCEFQIVRIQPDFGTVALTDMIVGRPLYWNDTKKFYITPLATITSKFAGICPVKLTSANSKGDIIPMITAGDVEMLMTAAITKATVAINDPVVLKVASSLADLDVLADATGWTNVQLAQRAGNLITALGTGGDGLVARCYLSGAYRVEGNGVM